MLPPAAAVRALGDSRLARALLEALSVAGSASNVRSAAGQRSGEATHTFSRFLQHHRPLLLWRQTPVPRCSRVTVSFYCSVLLCSLFYTTHFLHISRIL